MVSQFSELAQRHWIVGGVFVSLLWFIAGKQSLSKGRPDAAMLWQGVAALIALFLCVWTMIGKRWVGLAFAAVVLILELRSIHNIYGLRDHSR